LAGPLFLLFFFFFYSHAQHRALPSFPTRRSSDLRRFHGARLRYSRRMWSGSGWAAPVTLRPFRARVPAGAAARRPARTRARKGRDRKSTRLNSSHVAISYAVFCLKKKKKTNRKRT